MNLLNVRPLLRRPRTHTRRLVFDERGQVLPFVAIAFAALLGVAAMVVDIGHVLVSQQELQASTDSAALAGASDLPNASALTTARTYGSIAGSHNVRSNLPNVSMAAGYPMEKCLTTLTAQDIACSSPAGANAIIVRQQASVPLYFGVIFGQRSWTLTATSTAAARGGSAAPYNVAVVVDSTPSMSTQDANCGSTRINCALSGVRVLLQTLDPCATSLKTCVISGGNSANSVDRVSLFTFPQLTSSSAGSDYNCSSSAVAAQYTFPTAGGTSYSPSGSTYQVTPFHSDFRTSDSAASLNQNSNLTAAAGGVNGCSGVQSPNNAGDYRTYYASTLYAAQAALFAEKLANPGSENVMIVLGDGDSNAPQMNGSIHVMGDGATSNGSYPSWVGECGQAIKAAQAAAATGTAVYTVAYGSSASSGCSTDANAGTHPNITPCAALAAMASAPQYVFSDYNQSGSNSNCVSAQPVTALSDIFKQIANSLTHSRLIPNGTQ